MHKLFLTGLAIIAVVAGGLMIMQHVPGSQMAAVVPYTGNFKAQYFNDLTFTNKIVERWEPSINYDWGLGAPATGVNADKFTVRWGGDWYFNQGGNYRFTAVTDDGMKIKIDGILVFDSWKDQKAATYTFERNLSVGKHFIQVDYYENAGGAVAKLSWVNIDPPAPTPTPTPTPTPAPTPTPDPIVCTYNAKADLNGDGSINSTDLNILNANMGTTTALKGDINKDYSVDATDLGILSNAWQTKKGDAAYVAAADIDSSGTVDVTDLGFLATNWQKKISADAIKSDINADGIVNSADLTILNAGFGSSKSCETVPVEPISSDFDDESVIGTVDGSLDGKHKYTNADCNPTYTELTYWIRPRSLPPQKTLYHDGIIKNIINQKGMFIELSKYGYTFDQLTVRDVLIDNISHDYRFTSGCRMHNDGIYIRGGYSTTNLTLENITIRNTDSTVSPILLETGAVLNTFTVRNVNVYNNQNRVSFKSSNIEHMIIENSSLGSLYFAAYPKKVTIINSPSMLVYVDAMKAAGVNVTVK